MEAKKMTTRIEAEKETTTRPEKKEASPVGTAQPVALERSGQDEPDKNHSPDGVMEDDSIRSRQKPVWQLIVITFVTLTLNVPFWIYKTCSVLKKHAREAANNPDIQVSESIAKYANSRPWLNGLITTIPVVNFFVVATLFRDIASAIPDEENFARKNSTFAGLALALAMASIWMLGRLDGPAFLSFTLVSVPMAIAQSWLNSYWSKVEQQEYRGKTTFVGGGFSPIELISVVVGAMGLGLVVLGFSLQTP